MWTCCGEGTSDEASPKQRQMCSASAVVAACNCERSPSANRHALPRKPSGNDDCTGTGCCTGIFSLRIQNQTSGVLTGYTCYLRLARQMARSTRCRCFKRCYRAWRRSERRALVEVLWSVIRHFTPSTPAHWSGMHDRLPRISPLHLQTANHGLNLCESPLQFSKFNRSPFHDC